MLASQIDIWYTHADVQIFTGVDVSRLKILMVNVSWKKWAIIITYLFILDS